MTKTKVRSISPINPSALTNTALRDNAAAYETAEVEAYEAQVEIGVIVETVSVCWHSQPEPGVINRAGVSLGIETVWTDAASPTDAIERVYEGENPDEHHA